jgi:WD40 repeat protein
MFRRMQLVLGVLFGLCGVEACVLGKASASEKLPPRAVARLGSLAFAHGHTINAVALSPDGKLAATAGRGRFLYDEPGKGKWDYDLNIRLWQVPSGQQARVIVVPEGPVLALDFAPDGKSLAASAGKKVYQWDVTTGKLVQHARFDEYPLLVRFTGDGNHLLINLKNREIIKWDLAKRTEQGLWDDRKLDVKHYVQTLDLSPDGSRLGILVAKRPEAPDGATPQIPFPHRLEVLDLAAGKKLFEAEGQELALCLALSPDGKTVLFGDRQLAFWEIAGKKKQRDLPSIPAPPLHPSLAKLSRPVKEKEWLAAVAALYSPDGKQVVSMHETGDVFLWDAASGRKVSSLLHTSQFTPYLANEVLAFSADSKLLIVGGSHVLRLVDTVTGREVAPWDGHRLPISDIRFAPDGKTLFSRNEAELCSWNTRTWKPQQRHSLDSWQSKTILATSYEKKLNITWIKEKIFLQDFAGKELAQFPIKEKRFDGALFSFDGKTACLDVYSRDGDAAEKHVSATFYSIPDCKELFSLELNKVSSFALSPVRNTVTWIDDSGVFHEADGFTGKTLRKFDLLLDLKADADAFPLGTTYSWDGKYFVYQTLDRSANTLHIYDVDKARRVRQVSFPARNAITVCDISFDSRLLVFTQMGKKSIRVMELASGKERRPLAEDTEAASRLATSPIDFSLASVGAGSTVMIWDLNVPGRKLGKTELNGAEVTSLWKELAHDDAAEAEQAIETLVQAPARAVAFLRGSLKPVVPIPDADLDGWVSGLGSGDFAIRNKVIANLKKVLDQAEPVLRQTLAKGKLSLETQRRIEVLLKELPLPVDSGTLQTLRAIEVLEKIGTDDARDLLKNLSEGARLAPITSEAAAALDRLGRQPVGRGLAPKKG